MTQDRNDDLGDWQSEVAGFVLRALPPLPCRVLDVGCGNGWLVRVLDERGYEARGVDPQAPDGDARLARSRLEDFESDTPFDAAVAVLPFHHVDDLHVATAMIDRLLSPSGVVTCVEFAWNRFDDPTARWCVEHLPADLDDDNWLHELCRPFRGRPREAPLRASVSVDKWASERGFHSSKDMLDVLRSRFVEQQLEWGPYLFDDLAVDADTERTAIAEGRIAATSFRFVGRVG